MGRRPKNYVPPTVTAAVPPPPPKPPPPKPQPRRRRRVTPTPASAPAEPDEFYHISLTTSELLATLATLKVVSKIAEENPALLGEIEPEVLKTAYERIVDEAPDFLTGKSDRLAEALVESLSASNLNDVGGDSAKGRSYPPFPTGRTRRLLEQAFEAEQDVVIEYYVAYRNAWSVRRVTIEDVYESNDSWYLSGFCHLREDDRNFRLDHIRAVRLLDDETDDA